MGEQANTSETGGSLLGWLGFRGARGAAPELPEIAQSPGFAGTPPAKSDLIKQARRELLTAMTEFLLDNDLDVSADNLLAAHGAFSGRNSSLARQIAGRVHAGKRINQSWLDEAAADYAQGGSEALERLMGKLEASIDAFSTSSKAVRSASSDYGSQLEQHVIELGQVHDTGAIITSLADLAKAMAERTRRVEADMRRGEDEAKALRLSLERARRDAEVDFLTGLPNRRAFETVLQRHYREAQAEIDSLSVAFCDIDHFKGINDTHGHDTGDRVIRMIGQALAKLSNDNCHVARHGGEEFVMLFRGISLTEVTARLDEAREEMAARNMINRRTDEPIGRITFSGGVANVFGYPHTRDALSAADAALYRAKQAGRNQILIA